METLQTLHITLNHAFLASTLAALGWCIQKRRFVHLPPRPNTHRTLLQSPFISQFQLQLAVHFVFYTVELLATDLVHEFPSMAVHHVVALGIFFVYINDAGTTSVTTLFPFVFHSLFWVLLPVVADQPHYYYALLTAYNTVLHAVGIICLLNSFTLVAWDRLATSFKPDANERVHSNSMPYKPLICNTSPHILGVFAILEACVNYYSYCDHYTGTVCPPEGYFAAMAIGIFVFSCAAAWVASFLMVLEGCAPIGVLLGQRENGGGFWDLDDVDLSLDLRNVRGFLKLRQFAAGVKEVDGKEE
ncbi:hypothetical protein HDU78_000704 [Chytriomyces hyalinus]|nr:hypothetical protein HDU78_000704 [Chytriomyces hyalinus]